MKITFLVFLILTLGSIVGCTHSVHLVNVSGMELPVKINQGRVIESSSEQVTFLGFVTNTDYVNEAYNKLSDQCQSGIIQGITTRYSTDHGFFHWTNKINMKGLCIPTTISASIERNH